MNQHGDRMDDPATVHEMNVLTVVASESYKEFVAGLQKDIAASAVGAAAQGGRSLFHRQGAQDGGGRCSGDAADGKGDLPLSHQERLHR